MAVPWDKPIPIGESKQGQVTLPPLLPLLIGGATNAGKSGLMHTILAGLAQREHTQIILLDPKRVEFPPWQWGPRAACIASGPISCAQVLRLVKAEMQRRYKWCEEQRVKYLVPTAEVPRLVVVTDELAELTYSGDKGVLAVLQSILAVGRAAGIWKITATQRPDTEVLPGTIRDNHRVRICLGTESMDGTKMVLGPDAKNYPCHRIPESEPGHGWIRVDRRFTEFRSYFISEEQLELVIESTSRLRRDIPGFEAHVEDSEDDTSAPAPRRGRKTATSGR